MVIIMLDMKAAEGSEEFYALKPCNENSFVVKG